MARRDYAREYRSRQERARQRGFRSYAQERRERFRLQGLQLHPNFLRPGDFPLTSEEAYTGIQGPFSPSPDFDPSTQTPDWDYYWPTRTSFPHDSTNKQGPRTLQARYSRRFQWLEVVFRDGTPWHYEEVPPNLWQSFKRTASPGKFINAVLNDFPYGYGGWGNIVGEG